MVAPVDSWVGVFLSAVVPSPSWPTSFQPQTHRVPSDLRPTWTAATQEQRNKLARALFDQVWVEDDVVVAVKPGPELEPFFQLNYEECQKQILEVSTRRRVELLI